MSEAGSILQRPDPPGQAYSWLSVCSAHQIYEPSCQNCNVGHWVNNSYHALSSWLYDKNPKLWREWANGEARKVEGGDFLERVFPGLRRGKKP